MVMSRNTTRVVALVVVVGMLVSVLIASVGGFYASNAPDGLERVAEDAGFADEAVDSATADSPLAGYAVGGADGDGSSVAMAGIVGIGVTALAGFGLFAALRVRGTRPGA